LLIDIRENLVNDRKGVRELIEQQEHFLKTQVEPKIRHIDTAIEALRAKERANSSDVADGEMKRRVVQGYSPEKKVD
jgi:hypothetical protein